MPPESDQSEVYWQSHFSTKEMADAYAADIEKMAALQNEEVPRTEVKHDPEGGWNVWIWEQVK